MKKVIKGDEPYLLDSYKKVNPGNSWSDYSRHFNQRRQVKERLRNDQGGICAYCEIDLLERDSTGEADFRVEHFHPKSDASGNTNWGLAWSNLLGCCHGGSERRVREALDRFSSPDNCCDVPKSGKILDEVILNPTEIPAFPVIFSCKRSTGELQVNSGLCVDSGVSIQKAKNTISELRLFSPRLMRLRKATLDRLNMKINEMISDGLSVQDATQILSRATLVKNDNNSWPRFFTSIRSYLGSEAEVHLRSMNFDG